jgi:hypothetical protein
MFGPPKNVGGKCNARLFLGDDYGDNTCTIKCQLKLKHKLPHKEEFQREGRPITITWYVDESKEK